MFYGHKVSTATARRSVLASLVALSLGSTACDPGYNVVGRLVDPTGAQGTKCKVRLHRQAGEAEKYGAPCREPRDRSGDPEAWAVRVGQQFQCTGGPADEKLDLSVTCAGYENYRASSFEWKGPRAIYFQDLGDISLRRTDQPRGETSEQ